MPGCPAGRLERAYGREREQFLVVPHRRPLRRVRRERLRDGLEDGVLCHDERRKRKVSGVNHMSHENLGVCSRC